MNRIISDRLAKEKAKGGVDLDRRAAELDARERKLKAMELLNANGLDKSLIDAINMESDEQLNASINILKTLATQGVGGATVIGNINPIGAVGKNMVRDDLIRHAMGL